MSCFIPKSCSCLLTILILLWYSVTLGALFFFCLWVTSVREARLPVGHPWLAHECSCCPCQALIQLSSWCPFPAGCPEGTSPLPAQRGVSEQGPVILLWSRAPSTFVPALSCKTLTAFLGHLSCRKGLEAAFTPTSLLSARLTWLGGKWS